MTKKKCTRWVTAAWTSYSTSWVDDGRIGDAVRLGTGSSRASPAVMHSCLANNAQGPVTVRNEYRQSRGTPIDRLNYSVPGGVCYLFVGNDVPKVSFCVGLAEMV